MDAWNFQCHNENMVQGLVRIKSEQCALQLLEASGSAAHNMRWFVDVASSSVLPDVPRHVAWCAWDRQEDWEHYISRAKRDAPFGLVHGTHQLGIRVASDDTRLQAVACRWWMETTPRFWDVADACSLAESLGFCGVEMISKAQRKRGAAWMFRATRHDDLDCCQTVVDEESIHVVKEAKRRTARRKVQVLANERRVHFAAQTSSAWKSEDADMGVEDDDEEDVVPAAPWAPCLGSLVENEGQGDCLWYSLASALTEIGDKPRSHRQVRAFTVNYMLSHVEDWRHAWDGSGPKGGEFQGVFTDYLALQQKVRTWSGALELGAFAIALKQKVYVYEDTGRIHVFAPDAKSTPIFLKFHSYGHFEWLQNACEDEFLSQHKAQLLKDGKGKLSKPQFRGGGRDKASLSDFGSVKGLSAFGTPRSKQRAASSVAHLSSFPSTTRRKRKSLDVSLSEFAGDDSTVGSTASSSLPSVLWTCNLCSGLIHQLSVLRLGTSTSQRFILEFLLSNFTKGLQLLL